MNRVDDQPPRQPPHAARHPLRRATFLMLAVVVAAAGAYFGYDGYQLSRLAGSVRRSFAARRYDAVRGPLNRWLRERPRSGEAEYYRGWLALIDDRPDEAVAAIERAASLGFDPDKLRPMTGIYHARAGRIDQAEPLLAKAFEGKQEPAIEIAKELARIYLSTYRLPQAATAIERWRTLDPQNPQPYMWSNEVGSRSDAAPSILIRNDLAALERDPTLDKARFALAGHYSQERRFDEAEQEYREYLRRNPKDARALVGMGRNAFQSGDLDGASRYFEEALRVDPRQPDALKEMGQADLRRGQFARASRRFEILTDIDPYDHEVRYSFAQSLRLAGDAARAQAESERAARLREEHDRIVQLRSRILQDPKDLTSRFEVARWMLEHGHVDEGLKWTTEILRADPHHAPTHRMLTDYYQKRGETGLANYHRLMASSSP
jgi:tetratricopeptide (TPR) repeat protein